MKIGVFSEKFEKWSLAVPLLAIPLFLVEISWWGFFHFSTNTLLIFFLGNALLLGGLHQILSYYLVFAIPEGKKWSEERFGRKKLIVIAIGFFVFFVSLYFSADFLFKPARRLNRTWVYDIK